MTEKTKQIIELRKKKVPYEEVALVLGSSLKSIICICQKYRVTYKDIENAWKGEVENLRRQGKTYAEIASELKVNKDTVEDFCRRQGLGYSDLGQKIPVHWGNTWNKGKVITDWNARVKVQTNNRFELVDGHVLESSERSLLIRCRICGDEKTISSISLRGKKASNHIKCARCSHEATVLANERKKELDRQQREWEKAKKRNKTLVQVEMSFCKCGRLLPFGVRVCDECKRKTARQSERRKEQKRRLRAQAEFDKSITLEKLYERDHGVCYLCNKTCDWSDFQRINGNFIVGGSYPTVEHVKALCHGGTHTWDNVKLACHACNSKKGTKKLNNMPRYGQI